MEPAPVPGQQGEDGGQKKERQHGADPAQHGRAAGARMHPGPADAAEPEGQEKGGDAEGLQQQVGEPGAEEADPVVRWAGRWRCSARGRRGDRWPARGTGGARPAAAPAPETGSGDGCRVGDRTMRMGFMARALPCSAATGCAASEPLERQEQSQSSFYYGGWRGDFGQKRAGGTLVWTPWLGVRE